MGLHETKKLLLSKGTQRMRENPCQLYIWQGINNQDLQEVQKPKFPKIQWLNEEMGKWTKQKFSKE
jgi:hypothetical protein